MEQVNLNQAELWPRPTPFPARSMGVGVAALVVIIAGIYAYQTLLIDRQQAQLAALKGKREQVQRQVAQAEQANRERVASLEALRQEVADLQQRIGLFRRAGSVLNRRLASAGSKARLARGLGQARSGLTGVWLTRFRFDGVAPVTVRLEGRALNPELIPRYLQAVARQPAYNGGFFQDLKASEIEDQALPGDDPVLGFESEASFPVVTGGQP